MKVLCQVQSLSLLPWAWALMHLWPINTAWVNITVCCCNLCLRLVSWREEHMQYILHFLQDFFFPPVFFFAKTENTVHGLPLQRRFWRMCSRAWGYLCGILLMESIFGCDLIFTTFPLWEPALHSSTAWSRERKRELECYRSPDKDCSHCQVSRPGQLNTGGDPSTYAHPWDRDLEKRDGNRRGCQRVRFKVSSLWRQLICWKKV